LVLLSAALFLVPASRAQRYTFKNYVEGLGNLSVKSLYQDSQGFLWVGTFGGLFRYDGLRFDEFGPKDGLTVPIIEDINQDSAGRLWIASTNGLFVRTGQRFQELLVDGKPFSISVGLHFASLPDGTLIVSEVRGVYTVRPSKNALTWQVSTFLPANLIDEDTSAPHGVVAGPDGSIWFGCGLGLCRYQNSSLTKWNDRNGLPKAMWEYLLFDHEGQLWIRGKGHIAVLKQGATRFEARDIPGAPPSLEFRTLALDALGRILAPCDNKLARYEGGQWKLLSEANGLGGETVTTAITDREGSVWIGILGRGLQRWLGYDDWEHWTKAEGLHSNIVWDVLRDHTGRLWVGDDKGVSTMMPGSRELHPWSAPRNTMEGFTALAESKDGFVWLGFRNRGVISVDTVTLATQHFPSADVSRIFVDSHDRVWLATMGGLFVSDPAPGVGRNRTPFYRIHDSALPAGGTEGNVEDLTETPDHRLWAACDNGLVTFGPDGWTRVDLDWKSLATKTLLDVGSDPAGNVWLDGYFSGVVRLSLKGSQIVRSDRFQRPTVVSDRFVILASDHRGWVWLGGDRGVDVFDGQHWRRYTQDDGLVWNDTAERSFWADADGGVWIGTGGGLSHFTPHGFGALPPPAPVLESTRFGAVDIGNGASVPWRNDPLTFELASLTFRNENAIRFRYRLTGYEQEWTDTSEHEVRYPQLPPGSYRFEALSISGSDGTVSPVSTFSFRILPPWWKTRAFYGLSCLLAMALLAVAWRWSQRRILARQTEERTRRAALYARNLIEASLDPLVTISREGKITDVNQATEIITGVKREALIGSDFSEYFTDPNKARDVYQQVFAASKVRDYPLALRNASGGVTEVLYNASVFRNEAGEVEGVFAAARDITERKQLEDQLLQSQKLEAIGQLAGGVAHDFNNIMGVILGYAELAQGRVVPETAIAMHLSHIRSAAERAAALTRQLLAFSRKQFLQPEVINLNSIVVELAKMLGRLVGENIEIILQTSDDLGSVKADPVQIQQVLINLAVNARDAMPNGGKLVIATANAEFDALSGRLLSPAPLGNYVMVSVSDTGIGMNEETRSHIFEPFFSTKGLGKGTGLGLSIIYGIVKQSNGYIWAQSEPNRGSTFKICLPRVNQPSEPAIHEPHIVPVVSTATGTILLVEDEVLLADMAREVLEESGFRILHASSGEEALDLAEDFQGKIDLLLTDVVLRTGMDGTILARRLRASRPDLKVIYMSGYNDVLTSFSGKLDPGATLIEKPFTMGTLRARVREILSGPS